MSRRIVALTAGLSTPSSSRLLTDRLTGAVVAQVGARGEAAEVETIELRELAVPIATALATGVPQPQVDAARQSVTDADGLVAVTPVFAASYSGLFKSFVDLLEPQAMLGLPVLLGATAGTPRHSLVLDHALRPLFSYLRAVVVPTGVFAATEDFGAGGAELGARINRAAAELASLVVGDRVGVAGFSGADALAGAPATSRPRRSGVHLDAGVTPFEELLRGHDGG